MVGRYVDLSVDGGVDGWLDGRVPNWTLRMLWCKWDGSSITQNTWPAFVLSSRVNYTEQTCDAEHCDRAVMRPLACWDFGFESRRGHGCWSLLSVVYCQVEVSASVWSITQRSPTDCGVSHWVWSWILDTVEALATPGLLRRSKKKKCDCHHYKFNL
jgi:hypothetical protein